ncbi:MAG: hypothetical protein KatS3mg102_1698 [Planctomycetota bacterium]|nr:MAG: hypothetical protein KatS3mg102_1698 [Planctomycetota bacterium]
MIDLEAALRDPASVFATPEEVLRHPELAREHKIEILRRWEYDAREMQVAEEENMGDPAPPSDLLERVLAALHALGAWADTERSPPTKHGGV